MSTWAIRAAAVAMSAAALTATGAAPASAHNDLVRTTPAEGAVQNQAPAAVVFEFSEEIDPRFIETAVTGAAGSLAPSAAPQVDGTRLVQPVTLPRAGEYTVAYRVVSTDGHPVDGTVRFSTRAPSPGDAPGIPSAPGSAVPDPRAGGPEETASPWTAGGWLPVAGVFSALLLAATALLLLTRHRRHGEKDGRE